MNERDVRLLFDTGHWSSVSVAFEASEDGWQVYLNAIDKSEQEILTLKTGSPRNFKTSDTAINWCHDIGFKKISVHLAPTNNFQTDFSQDIINIVLIEDNIADIELTLRAFQKLNANINVLVLQDGNEALDFLFAKGKYKTRKEEELPKIILLDLKLPKVNGHEVLKEIRTNQDTSHIPVIILTTSTEEDDITTSYNLGGNSFIRKPIAYEEFCNLVEEIGSYWLNINTCL